MPDIWSEFKKYLGDALPGGALNPELTTDINESPVPVGMAALRSFLGEAPDQLGVSVFHPQYRDIMRAANPTFAAGTTLSVVPVMSGLSALRASKGTVLSAAPRNVEGALSRQAGIFVVPKDTPATRQALRMRDSGSNPRDIWRETGIWTDTPDKIPRLEIDDSLARYRPGAIASQAGSRDEIIAPMHMVLEHPDLYAAVGPLKHYGWNVSSSKVPGGGAYYSHKSGNVVLHPESAYGLESGKSTTLHELQHAIQSREGLALGGNPGMFPTPLINDAKTIADELAQGTDRMTINRWFKSTYGRSPDPAAWDLAEHPMIDRMIADDPVENYARLAGEAEARAVQARMKMSPEERRATYPADSYDRPIDQLIIHSDENPMYSNYARGGLAQLKECSCGR